MKSTRIDGVVYVPAFLADADALFDLLRTSVAWDDRMKARRTASFGVPYDYSGMTYRETPFPGAVSPLLDRLETLLGYRANNCLANYYPTGDATMGFHADATDRFAPGAGIAIVSLGAARSLVFRRADRHATTEEFVLEPGSLLHMTADVQREWQHALPARPKAGGRISLTFRRLN